MKNHSFSKKLGLLLISVIVVMLSAIILNSQEKKNVPARLDMGSLFYSTGWMGDGQYNETYVHFNGVCKVKPHSAPTCIQIDYTFGPLKWAGIYWQNRPDNWGDEPGNDYSKTGYTRISFWAKGVTGTEMIEFKAGDIKDASKKYHDSFAVSLGRIMLSREWKQYALDISKSDLSSVIGGFCWVASKDYNDANSITFYLDDIYYE